MTPDPRSFYSQALAERQSDIAARERRNGALAYWRLAAAMAFAAIAGAALFQAISVLWAALPAAAFFALAVHHERLLRELERRRRAARFFERGLARLEGNWAGTGARGESYLDPAHPYARDLDLFGKGSLFELLCAARTHIGEETLARWLLHPAPPATVRARQEAIEELRPRVDLREDLAILAEEARTGVDPGALAAWGEAPPLLAGGSGETGVWLLSVLGTIALAAFLAFDAASLGLLRISGGASALLRDFFLLALIVNGYFLHRFQKTAGSVVAAVEQAAQELKLLSETLV
ncbi:MAG TPA: hypothetical protein VMU19_15450, partial [Bryobacteraceae bacterium]|nr:hypothetical protein [Bryobacteraceae bacterium]